MNRFDSINKPLLWFLAIVLTTLVVACGGNAILGGNISALVDLIKPRVTATVPVNGSTTQPANAALTAIFTEAMAPATISTTSFTLRDTTASAAVAASSVGYVVASRTAKFTPAAPLTPGDSYTATISTAATDLAGNALAGNQAALPAASNYVWSFTAAAPDVTAPLITLETPASGVAGVALNSSVNATFNEAMDPATICDAAHLTATCPAASFTLATSAVSPVSVLGAVTYDAVNNIATFTPSSNLAPSTSYTATVTHTATDLAGNALVVPAVTIPGNPWSFTTGTGLAPGAPALGTASTFGIMATAAVTAASASVINGDVSLNPGTSITGFPPAIVNGTVHVNDTVSTQAKADLLAAYNNANGLACATTVGTTDLGTLYVYPTGIPPGVYCSGSTMLVGAHIVLDGGGNANAVWVFQVGTSLTSNADVTLTGGAQAKNVFWVTGAAATVGSGTTFNGTILAGGDASSAGSATINGRILAGAITPGTIALNGPPSTVNVPAP